MSKTATVTDEHKAAADAGFSPGSEIHAAIHAGDHAKLRKWLDKFHVGSKPHNTLSEILNSSDSATE